MLVAYKMTYLFWPSWCEFHVQWSGITFSVFAADCKIFTLLWKDYLIQSAKWISFSQMSIFSRAGPLSKTITSVCPNECLSSTVCGFFFTSSRYYLRFYNWNAKFLDLLWGWNLPFLQIPYRVLSNYPCRFVGLFFRLLFIYKSLRDLLFI